MLFKNNVKRARRSPQAALRSRVAIAFRVIARGVDPVTAFARYQSFHRLFYRSGGREWTRSVA